MIGCIKLLLCCSLVYGVEVTVNTKYGDVIGKSVKLDTGQIIDSFYAIPFAKPPVGPLRFQPPEEPDSWSKPRKAFKYGKVCPQDKRGILQLTHPLWGFLQGGFSEDCLHLNIFSPHDASGGPYPVMVWIHGGGYSGSGNIQYPGQFLAAYDVVVVVINYRLGALGFMSTNDDVAPGNYGLMDQILALKFVNENINNFGGNPDKVTLFGQSSGAASVGLLNLIPETKGLFHQMILESGCDQAIWAVTGIEQHPETYTQFVAHNLSCPTSPSQAMMDCLRSKDPFEITNVKFNCTPGFFCLGFSPVVDGTLLTKHPEYLRQEGSFEPVPTIIGQTSDDGSYYTTPLTGAGSANITEEHFQKYLKRLINIFSPRFPDKTQKVYRALKNYYTPDTDVYGSDDYIHQLNMIITDYGFGYPNDLTMKQIDNAGGSVFAYVLGYRSKMASAVYPEWMGVPHDGELPYVWGYPLLKQNKDVRRQSGMLLDIIHWNEEDKDYTNFIQTMWTNFAKTGDPTPSPVKAPFGNQPFSWQKLDASIQPPNIHYAHLFRTIESRKNYRQEETAFWNSYMTELVPEMFWHETPTNNIYT